MVKAIFEYIWIGGGGEFRSKSRVIELDVQENLKVGDLPSWNYDGSSTGQADGSNSEIQLRPVAIYRDPIKKSANCFMVLCETFNYEGVPLENNYRTWAYSLFSEKSESEPWFGIEQEYFILDPESETPIGNRHVVSATSDVQGQYYCGVGASNIFGRNVAEEHLAACLYANLNISGINAEVAPAQWEYQIGPCTGIIAGDQLMISRYLLERIAENHGYVISYVPKPFRNLNGSGCHTNYSTKSMREGADGRDGIEFINEAIEKLSLAHNEHMEVYGAQNESRMTGEHETATFDTFSSGKANRGASVRIGNDTINNKKGYFEDRRPAANMNPYLVTATIYQTTVLR